MLTLNYILFTCLHDQIHISLSVRAICSPFGYTLMMFDVPMSIIPFHNKPTFTIMIHMHIFCVFLTIIMLVKPLLWGYPIHVFRFPLKWNKKNTLQWLEINWVVMAIYFRWLSYIMTNDKKASMSSAKKLKNKQFQNIKRLSHSFSFPVGQMHQNQVNLFSFLRYCFRKTLFKM